MPKPLLAATLRSRPVDFEQWRKRPITARDLDVVEWPLDEYAVVVPATPGGPSQSESAFERVRGCILALDLFPRDSVVLHADTPDGRAALGATVVQHLFLGPFAIASAVRIVALEDGAEDDTRRVSLAWATLAGHPERGVERFIASLPPGGPLELSIQARSRPGPLLVRLAGPVTRRLQIRFTRRSLAHLAAAAAGSPDPPDQVLPGRRGVSSSSG